MVSYPFFVFTLYLGWGFPVTRTSCTFWTLQCLRWFSCFACAVCRPFRTGVRANAQQRNVSRVYPHGNQSSLYLPPHLRCRNIRLPVKMAGAVSMNLRLYPRCFSLLWYLAVYISNVGLPHYYEHEFTTHLDTVIGMECVWYVICLGFLGIRRTSHERAHIWRRYDIQNVMRLGSHRFKQLTPQS